MNKIILFICVDVVDYICCIYRYLLSLYYILVYYKSPLVVTYAYAKCLESPSKIKIITREISQGLSWKFSSKHYNVYIYYKHIPSLTDYAIVYNNCNPIHFPPYNYSVYSKKIRPGILSIMINNKDETDTLRLFCGPKQNFYADLQDTDISWISPKHTNDSIISIVNTRGETKMISPLTMKTV